MKQQRHLRDACMTIALACIAAVGPLAGSAMASHNRGLQVDWVETTPNSADFRVTSAYRCDAFFTECNAQVGQ
ncbi:MAG: hypothetical protein ACRDLD_01690, partial [Thermoleophilaceae bacterium]